MDNTYNKYFNIDDADLDFSVDNYERFLTEKEEYKSAWNAYVEGWN